MSTVDTGTPAETNKTLEERVKELEDGAKKTAQRATAIALAAALLGGGGLAGVVQWMAGARLRAAEIKLKQQQQQINDQDMRLKEQDAQQKQQMAQHELALKDQARVMGEYDIKLKGLSLHRDEFNDRLKAFETASASLERSIAAARRAGAGGPNLDRLVQELVAQTQEFSNFAAQTRRYVEELPGAPGWYKSAVAQAETSSRQHAQQLALIKNQIAQ